MSEVKVKFLNEWKKELEAVDNIYGYSCEMELIQIDYALALYADENVSSSKRINELMLASKMYKRISTSKSGEYLYVGHGSNTTSYRLLSAKNKTSEEKFEENKIFWMYFEMFNQLEEAQQEASVDTEESESTDDLGVIEHEEKKAENGTAFYKVYRNGVVRYGFIDNNKHVWSSNLDYICAIFHKHFYTVNINGREMDITLEKLKELSNKGVIDKTDELDLITRRFYN